MPIEVVDQADKVEEKIRVEFHANPVQHRFIQSRARADLFAARMGEGKSAALCWAAFHHTRNNPGALQIFIRDTWENLRDTTQKEFFEWFPPGVMGEYKDSTKTWKWKVGEMRGEVKWIGLDTADSATKLQSRPLGGIFMDEPAPATGHGGIDELVFTTAMSRLRQKGMNYYVAKLAENNPDENHWTYRLFVDPGTDDYKCWQTQDPENLKNLPRNYYANMRTDFKGRPDLVRRFVEGTFGFQQEGKSVTPEWSDAMHLSLGLVPVEGVKLWMGWDFGLNPTCVFSQATPMGHWNIPFAVVGQDIGVEELIEAYVRPEVFDRWQNFEIIHTGDPAGMQREQSNSQRTAVRSIKEMIGGRFLPGPMSVSDRLNPLRTVLRRTVNGLGVVQVDQQHAKAVWHALRGGWHREIHRNGTVSESPKKDIHSHPGDATGYLAAKLYALKSLAKPKRSAGLVQRAQYWRRGVTVPKEMHTLGGK